MNEKHISSLDQALALLQKAVVSHQAGNLDGAIEMYKESINICPTPDAHTHLGWAYSRSGNTEAAIEECKRAIEIAPDYGNPYNDIGAYLIELGQHRDAVEWLERALHSPDYATPHFPHYNLGRVAERYGEWYDAMYHYRTAYDLAPHFKPALQALLRLQAMMN